MAELKRQREISMEQETLLNSFSVSFRPVLFCTKKTVVDTRNVEAFNQVTMTTFGPFVFNHWTMENLVPSALAFFSAPPSLPSFPCYCVYFGIVSTYTMFIPNSSSSKRELGLPKATLGYPETR